MMTKEEKELLLKDLCARLPYGVKCVGDDRYLGILSGANIGNIYTVFFLKGVDPSFSIERIKPYLRSMSSMTEKEESEYCSLKLEVSADKFLVPSYNTIGWLNEHHLDYRGLIEKGLAIEATKGMYNIK